MQFVMLPVNNLVWFFLFDEISQYLKGCMKKKRISVVPLSFIQRMNFEILHRTLTF